MSAHANGAPIAVCYGTRPQVIKASLLLETLRARWRVLAVDTGQHYDYELDRLLYEQLGVAPPDLHLEVGSGAHAEQAATILMRAAAAFVAHRPRAVVVIGDTNSTLGCALAAVQLRLPLVHVEAGLRADDLGMAEEINRRMVDAVARVLCAPSSAAVERLGRERPDGIVRLTGDIARDVLARHVARARPADPARWPLPAGTPYIFATLHRAELVDRADHLTDVLCALGRAPYPVVLAAHPRTRAALAAARHVVRVPATVHVLPALGYLEALACVRDAALVVTDSGGVQREAYWLGTPCVTLRRETEWRETVACGANALVAPHAVADELPAVLLARAAAPRAAWDRDAYGDGTAAARIADAVALVADEGAGVVAPMRLSSGRAYDQSGSQTPGIAT